MAFNNRLWQELLCGPHAQEWQQAAMDRVAQGLSQMLNTPVHHDPPRFRRLPLAEAPTPIDTLKAEMVGVYLEIESGLRGWCVLALPVSLALNLADLAIGRPPGTSQRLGEIERSALAEVGNLTLAYFLNALAELDEQNSELMPTPPGVVVDMLGAILDLLATPAAEFGDELLILETTFRDKAKAKTIQIRFWVLPDLSALGTPSP